jgi:S-adenosylmethionine synthetase
MPDERLQRLIEKSEVFDFRPARMIEALNLKRPSANGWSYRQTAAYGHFGRPEFPWEKTDKVEALKALAAKG